MHFFYRTSAGGATRYDYDFHSQLCGSLCGKRSLFISFFVCLSVCPINEKFMNGFCYVFLELGLRNNQFHFASDEEKHITNM